MEDTESVGVPENEETPKRVVATIPSPEHLARQLAKQTKELAKTYEGWKTYGKKTTKEIFKFSCQYVDLGKATAMYLPAAGREEARKELAAYKFSKATIQRFENVAEVREDFESVLDSIPASLEAMAEVARAYKQDAENVLKAIEEGRLTPEGGLEQARAVRQAGNPRVPDGRRKQGRGAQQVVRGSTVATPKDEAHGDVAAALKKLGTTEQDADPSLVKGITEAVHKAHSQEATPDLVIIGHGTGQASETERGQSATGAMVVGAKPSAPKLTFSGSVDKGVSMAQRAVSKGCHLS